MSKFVEFKSKEKFAKEIRLPYPGISDPKLKAPLTEKINQVADDFKRIAEKGKAIDNEYQNVIKKGLSRFSTLYARLDTEDRERICSYFEELMDIVGLESSDGQLNTCMYDFNLPRNNLVKY